MVESQLTSLRGGVTELADVAASKAAALHCACGFKSHPRYHSPNAFPNYTATHGMWCPCSATGSPTVNGHTGVGVTLCPSRGSGGGGIASRSARREATDSAPFDGRCFRRFCHVTVPLHYIALPLVLHKAMAEKDIDPKYTPESSLSTEFVTLLKNVTAKRARCVIDHILKHGFITTEDLKNTYGYHHPPRAARDVREQGIPLENFPVKDADGRSITAYKFADLSKIEQFKLGGRQVFSKLTRKSLYERQGGRCGVCHQEYAERYLQVDHRVPYEVGGDSGADESDLDAFMSICASCQRSKSWTCEHCANWTKGKNPDLCRSCYWGSPEGYAHIALEAVRREVLIWQGPDIEQYERISREAKNAKLPVAEYIKTILPKRS